VTDLPDRTIFTLGHSTRGFDELLNLLRQYAIACLIDVRKAPASRRMPHFAKQELERTLPRAGIEYLHIKELGGWRKPVPDSPNTGWRTKGFQGYADYMSTSDFEQALTRVTEIAATQPTAIMCAEALWWRCHRMLISDALVTRGWRVLHVGAGSSPEDHRLTSFAVVEGGRLMYPPTQPTLEHEVRRS
jgi:uncharacterized protein (DUF488 family)